MNNFHRLFYPFLSINTCPNWDDRQLLGCRTISAVPVTNNRPVMSYSHTWGVIHMSCLIHFFNGCLELICSFGVLVHGGTMSYIKISVAWLFWSYYVLRQGISTGDGYLKQPKQASCAPLGPLTHLRSICYPKPKTLAKLEIWKLLVPKFTYNGIWYFLVLLAVYGAFQLPVRAHEELWRQELV